MRLAGKPQVAGMAAVAACGSGASRDREPPDRDETIFRREHDAARSRLAPLLQCNMQPRACLLEKRSRLLAAALTKATDRSADYESTDSVCVASR